MAESPIVLEVKELQDKKTFAMNGKQREQYTLILNRLAHARSQRNKAWDEFDGMTYEQAYLVNQRANFSYLAPKLNNDDVRINTSTTEKKVEFVLSNLLSLNLMGEILAFDKDDNFMEEVAQTFTSLVHRTEEMEEAKEKRLFIYAELLSQPCVFVEELWVERKVRGAGGKMQTINRCERRLLQGTQVYLGDINLPDYRFQEQPYVFKYFRMTYDEGKTVFGDLERWQYVKKGSYQSLLPPPYQVYRKNSLLEDEIEGYCYYCPTDNEYQLILQGVPMYEPGEPLPWDWEGYNMIQVGLKPYHGDFAYSRSLTAAAKTLQALDNEMIRNAVRKFRQAIEPPTGTPAGKVFSRDIWSAGSMVQGVTKDNFSRLIEHDGVTTSELAMLDMINQKTNEFIGTDAMSALATGDKITAQQTVTLQKIALQMIGLSVLAAVRLESKLSMMRVKNIVSNYSKPVSKKFDPVAKKVRDVYARFTLQDTGLPDGSTGTKIIQFTDENPTEDEVGAMYADEQKLKGKGKPTSFVSVNAPMLKEVGLYFHATAVPQPEDSKELDKVMYQDELSQAALVAQMTGRPLNADKVTEKFERIWGSKDLFEKQPMGVQPMMQPEGQAAPGANPLKPQNPRPSINTMMNA